MKKFMTLALATVAFAFSMSSCGNDDEPEVAVATQVAGSYSGNEVFVVDNEESSNETKSYQFTKVTDVSVDLQIPEVGMGMKEWSSSPYRPLESVNRLMRL